MSTDRATTAFPRESGLRDVSKTSTEAHNPRAAVREVLIGYGTLVASLLVIGLLLAHPLDGTVGRWDLDVNQWFAARRGEPWTAVSGFLSLLLDTLPVIGIALVAVAVLGWRHQLREALVIAVGLVLEITVFLSLTFLVARPRPDVPRLSSAPMTSSFPSGHTAAAVVLYGGIALAIGSSTRSRLLHSLLWTSVGIVVVGVGVTRVYRGMHHPTDVAVGVMFGVAALWFAWQAVHAYFEGVRSPDLEAAR